MCIRDRNIEQFHSAGLIGIINLQLRIKKSKFERNFGRNRTPYLFYFFNRFFMISFSKTNNHLAIVIIIWKIYYSLGCFSETAILSIVDNTYNSIVFTSHSKVYAFALSLIHI